ncbi:MAG: zeta toxin family protein [Bacteroidota bacterium]
MSGANLIIIAGPNGAGKSTIGKSLIPEYQVEIFDFDKEYYSIWAKFGFDPAVRSGCLDRASEKFNQEFKLALRNKKSFCFETNYHTKTVLKYREQAKKEGFYCHLIFVGLESPELAKERVTKRVQLNGHFVPDKEVEERYSAGLSSLSESFHLYDKVEIMESLPDYHLKTCIVIEAGKGLLIQKPKFLHSIPKLEESIKNFEKKVDKNRGLSK